MKLERYKYEGLGFPIYLENVDAYKFDGDIHPIIDIRTVNCWAIRFLMMKNEMFIGSHIAFIRKYFSFTIKEFSKEIKLPEEIIEGWEFCGQYPTNMSTVMQMKIQNYIFDRLLKKGN
ncbi:hypothetical protein UFOVP459_50 [uncultured Caudovirales phage]|uniref:Uncharacterized protein n=1 Tax=uncultured Caudovirales phage TaxID=2100421 RepID=A0A6J5SGR2_9CAUD|nr:hypothetical protein UFOVP459_50 [uncultured Caudovirales phage]CAB4183050.1 hypothetical protein UFOVP1089_35 [uncultured Caudovirales phage]CAB4212998.1 hypothetical protein UFOVP1443_54 [uncultured Caudovirales phage]